MKKQIINQILTELKNRDMTVEDLSKKMDMDINTLKYTLYGQGKLTFVRFVEICQAIGIESEIKVHNTTIKLN